MSTTAKIIIGYTDHMGYWNTTEEYVRWQDGYSEAVIPQMKEHTSADTGFDIEAFNDAMPHESWKLNKIPPEDSYNFRQMNYHYYIDQSNWNRIVCSVLKEDFSMYSKFNVMNMQVEQELVL